MCENIIIKKSFSDFSFINVLAETNDHQKLYICVSGNGVNIDFTAGI